MLGYHTIDPNIVKIGPIQLRWYGLMYIIGFLASFFLVKHQIKKKRFDIDLNIINDLYLFLIIGLIIGARLGYVLFYNLPFYIHHPLKIFAVWEGGMSFHGGLIGIALFAIAYIKKRGLDFWRLADLISVTAPIGLGLGRLGNFINGELYGRVTDLPWGIIFPSGGDFPRHPSQIYEFLLEGVALFTILWLLKDRDYKKGTMLCLFLLLYSAFRFLAEFFRQPDPQLGFILSFLTMGQILSIIMAASGFLLLRLRPSG